MRGRTATAAGPAAVAALVTLAASAGCAVDSVQVEPPQASASAAAACRKLHAGLPKKLHGGDRRSTIPESDRTAVWGDPAIALRCGVPRPVELRPDSQLAQINGLAWLPQPESRPTRFTLLGRAAYVEMTVPRTVKLPGEVLSELAPRLKAALPARPGGRL